MIYREKLDSLYYIFVAHSIALSSTTLMRSASKATEFSEIMQSKGHYTVQGHARSLILVPVKSSYATSL